MINTLIPLADEDYKRFYSKLIPTVNPDCILGIRTPKLRKLSKELDENSANAFMGILPHKYYEENNLLGFLIEKIKDYDFVI